jgi:hypothetical protein
MQLDYAIGYYNGTSLCGQLCQEATSLSRTEKFSNKLVITIQFDLCNQDTSLMRTAFVSAKGVFNTEVLLYSLSRGQMLHYENICQ